MNKSNKIQDCTHPVPANKHGIFALHCEDNQPISATDLKKILDGPIAAVESAYVTELSKPVELRKH
jgi:hypothetical protein